MTKPTPRKGTQILDSTIDGEPVVLKEISNKPGRFAIVDKADFERLERQGLTSIPWRGNSNRGSGAKGARLYVRAKVNGENTQIARLVLEEPSRETVSHKNDNRLDMRRCNLTTAKAKQKLKRRVGRDTRA